MTFTLESVLCADVAPSFNLIYWQYWTVRDAEHVHIMRVFGAQTSIMKGNRGGAHLCDECLPFSRDFSIKLAISLIWERAEDSMVLHIPRLELYTLGGQFD